MAKTIRRKHYTPVWVTRETIWIDGPAGYVQLEGDQRAAKLRWWHEDKSKCWGAVPAKSFRKSQQVIYRQQCRAELQRFVKNGEHEVMILAKQPYPYWD